MRVEDLVCQHLVSCFLVALASSNHDQVEAADVVVRRGLQAQQRELVVLEAGLEELIGRSHQLDPADCTDRQICHIIAATT